MALQDLIPGHEQGLWDDLRFPAQAINPPGGAEDPDVEPTTGLLLFDPDNTEVIAGVAQFPHGWVEGSYIYPHVHWTKTSSASGNVLWRLRYEWVNNGEIFTGNYSNTLDISNVVEGITDDNTSGQCLVSSFDGIDGAGKTLSSILFWGVLRVGGNEADTYAADARLIEFDIHYMKDSLGSVDQFEKNYTSS